MCCQPANRTVKLVGARLKVAPEVPSFGVGELLVSSIQQAKGPSAWDGSYALFVWAAGLTGSLKV